MDIDSFYLLGFNRTEVKLYLTLLEHGKSGAQSLAKRTGLPRSTAYSGLESLVSKEVIQKEERRGSTFFRIDDPKHILDLVAAEQERVSKREVIATQLVSQLAPLFTSKSYSVPKLEFFEGKSKVSRFLDEMLPAWCDSMLKYEPLSTWGFQDHSFITVFNKYIRKFWKVVHEEAEIPGRILSNRSKTEAELVGQVRGREVRALESPINFTSSIWVLGDYIVMIMTRSEPIYAFQIVDPVFAANLRELFRHLYEQSSSDLSEKS